MLWTAFLVAIFLWSWGPPLDFDLCYQLRNGEEVLRTWNPLHGQHFLGSAEDLKPTGYINDEWLFAVMAHLVYNLAGQPGLAVLRALLVTGIFGVVAASLRVQRFSPGLGVAWLFIASRLFQSRLMLRPHLISDLFLAVIVHLWLRKQFRPWLALPIFAVWANFHAGVVAGLVTLALLSMSEPARWREHLQRLICAGLGTLITPGGWRLYTYLGDHIAHRVDMDWVLEWQPLLPEQLFGFIGLYLLLYWGSALYWRRSAAILVGGFYTWSLTQAVRALGELAVVTPPLVRFREFRGDKWLGLAGVAALLGLRLLSPVSWKPDSTGEYPEGALRWLFKHQVSGTIVNSYHFGGYIAFRHMQPYIHGIVAAYDLKRFRDYLDLLEARDGPDRAAQFADAVLLHYAPFNDAHVAFSRRLSGSDKWSLVYFDDTCVLFVKRKYAEGFRSINPSLERPLLGAVDEVRKDLDASRNDTAAWLRLQALELEREGQDAQALDVWNSAIETHRWDGRLLLARGALKAKLGQLEEAAKDFEACPPTSAVAAYNLAIVRLRQAQQGGPDQEKLLGKARQAAQRAVRNDPQFEAAKQLRDKLRL